MFYARHARDALCAMRAMRDARNARRAPCAMRAGSSRRIFTRDARLGRWCERNGHDGASAMHAMHAICAMYHSKHVFSMRDIRARHALRDAFDVRCAPCAGRATPNKFAHTRAPCTTSLFRVLELAEVRYLVR